MNSNMTQNTKPNKSAIAVTTEKREPLFSLGRIVATPGAIAEMAKSAENAIKFLSRHERGDWGDCTKEDASENDLSVRQGFRIFSVYHTAKGTKIYVITERDRSVTTILLPGEY